MFIVTGEVLKRAEDIPPAVSGTLICEAQKGCHATTKESSRGILRHLNSNHLRGILISSKVSVLKRKSTVGTRQDTLEDYFKMLLKT